jgi:hypothetical protein
MRQTAGSDPGLFSARHCERSEAIHVTTSVGMDCFVASAPRNDEVAPPQSSGSTLTIEAPSLLPTQKLTGVVELSTKTLRILVERGSR